MREVAVMSMIVFAKVTKIVAEAVLDGMDELTLRLVGLLAVLFGLALAAFGAALL